MKSWWMKIATFVFVVAVVLGMSLPKSQAMSLANGKFTLPFAGKLGGMSLPAGDYTYTVEGGKAEFGIITIYQNQRTVGVMLAQSFESHEDKSQYPVLVFVRHDGNSVLRAFRLPGTGTFYFTLPKEMKTLIAQQPQLIETIQVQASGD